MKKSIEINLGGRIFNIDDDAYELLNEYIESLRANFKDNEEGEEIVADIELRLGELCEERMHDGRARIIDYAMVAEFTERMGRPDSIADVEEKHADDKETPSPQDTPASDCREPWRDAMLLGRRLFRDTHNSLLGGVFSGLAAYSGINVWLLRVAAILLTLFVLEIIVPIVYLIAWLVLPYAKSVTDRMRMREIKPQPGESREDAWRREYERSTAEVLNNAGATDNKGCLSGCLISLALFILLPIILFLYGGGMKSPKANMPM
jgi:phage shock protein C